MIKCTLRYCEQSCIIQPPKDRKQLAVKYAFNPVLSEVKNNFGSVWYQDGLYHLFYADFTNIYHSISKNGLRWSSGQKILSGETGNWDKGLDCASVFKVPKSSKGAGWFIFYRGHNEWEKLPSHQIGLAYMINYRWRKHSENPILSPSSGNWDGIYNDNGKPTIFDPWGIMKVDSLYYLWFNSDNPKTCRSTGLAVSKDLISWRQDQNNPIFKNGRFCVCPFRCADYYYMVVTAGGYQRRHNWFELYRCRFPTFYEDEREYLGVLLRCGSYGDFDYGYIDGPSILTDNVQRIVPEGQEIRLYYTGERQVGDWSHGLATFNIE